MANPWLQVPAKDYECHMEHESVRQGEMIRKHLGRCLERFEPESLLYLGAGVGNGLEDDRASALNDILAVDIQPEFLAILRDRFKDLAPLRIRECRFPEEFEEPNRFQLAYGALFFEYVALEGTLAAVGACLAPDGHLVALLQQPSKEGQMTNTGVTSLEKILPIMTLHGPEAFLQTADRVGMFTPVSTLLLPSPCGKPFCEITLRKVSPSPVREPDLKGDRR
ncbi:MAG: class I SAM-dependent methyltransferase [Planctomycetota bacterium]|jgi:SAM-dependent methyltransferase